MPERKKMSLTQLTFLVTVNMMGSGIIMLPTNMAKVAAISLLPWTVTAAGPRLGIRWAPTVTG